MRENSGAFSSPRSCRELPLQNAFQRGEVRVPGSKSCTNRALILAALARGTSRLRGALRAEDTEVMIAALRALEVAVRWAGEGVLEVEGTGGDFAPGDKRIYVGNAGTAARFLLPLLAFRCGRTEVWSAPRMEERPMGELIDALRLLGLEIEVPSTGESFPLVVVGRGALAGGELKVDGGRSSQFISALLLAAPYCRKPLRLVREGTQVSSSYISLTRKMMADFGVESTQSESVLQCAAGSLYQGRELEIEGDASSASYFFAMAAISGGSLLVRGVRRGSSQGDSGFITLLEQMGCAVNESDEGVRISREGKLRGIPAEMSTMSDVALTLGVVALFAEGTTRISGVGHLRWKECDRIAALVEELRKVGGEISAGEDWIEIVGGRPLRGARLGTHGDHRMAMALALLSLRVEGVSLEDAACVEKTYPGFFADFNTVTQNDTKKQLTITI